jgi:hypothetical protein
VSDTQRIARFFIGVLAISFLVCWFWQRLDPEGFARKAGEGATAYLVGTVTLAFILTWLGGMAVMALLWLCGLKVIERERLRELEENESELRALQERFAEHDAANMQT